MAEDQRKRRILLCAVVHFFAVFTVVIFTPYDIFFSNRADFSFAFADFWWINLSFGAVLFALLMVLSLVLPEGLGEKLLTLEFVLPVGFWLQRMFMNRHVPVLTGASFSPLRHPLWAAGNLAVWVLLIGGAFLLRRFRRELWRTVVLFLSCALVLVQGAGLVGLLLGGDPAVGRALTEEGMLEVGEKNVIIFCLDYYDNTFVDDILGQDPAFFDCLEGFTYYENTAGVYAQSYPSHTFLLTGVEQDEYYQLPYQQAVELAFERSSYFDEIQSLGYDVYLYTNAAYVGEGEESRVKNFSREMDLPYFETLGGLLSCERYFVAPYVLKPLFTQAVGMNTARNTWSECSVQDDASFYTGLCEKGLERKEGNQFKYYHLTGGHPPYQLDENVRVVPGTGTGAIRQYMGEMRIVFKFLERMKALGVYDDSVILITADHGEKKTTLLEPDKAMSPILFYKPAGKTDSSFTISDLPLSHWDIFPTVIAGMGGDPTPYGTPIEEIETGERERIFHHLVLVDGREYLVRDYDITGDAKDISGWIYTGNSLRVVDSMNPVLGEDYPDLAQLEAEARELGETESDARLSELSLEYESLCLRVEGRIDLPGGVGERDEVYALLTDPAGRAALYPAQQGEDGEGGRAFSCQINMVLFSSGTYRVDAAVIPAGSEVAHRSESGETFLFEPTIGVLRQISQRVARLESGDLAQEWNAIPEPRMSYIGPWTDEGKHILLFDGWVDAQARNGEEPQILLAVTDEKGAVSAFSTAAQKGEYLAEQTGMTNVDYGFYRACIRKEELPEGDFTVEVYVRYPEGVYRTESRITTRLDTPVSHAENS